MSNWRRVALALWASVFLCVGNGAIAQDVTLKSRDGSISLSGNFLSYDGENYRIQSDLGVLTVEASGVLCEGPGCPDLNAYFTTLRIGADREITSDLLKPLVDAFAHQHGYSLSWQQDDPAVLTAQLRDGDQPVSELSFHYPAPGSGLDPMTAGEVDVAVLRRAANRAEIKRGIEEDLGDFGSPLRGRVLALDADSVFVHPNNPLPALTLGALGDILAGKTKNWQTLGGLDAPIAIRFLGEPTQTLRNLMKVVPGIGADSVDRLADSHALEADEGFVRDPYALYLGPISLATGLKAVPLSGACGFEATASDFDVKTEDYPLVRPVFLYTPAYRMPKLAREFLGFSIGPDGQRVLSTTQLVGQSPVSIPLSQHGRRLKNAIAGAGEDTSLAALQSAVELLSGKDRLSLGFRFKEGSTQLDAQSLSNVHLLARFLEQGRFKSKALTFIGFSDGNGEPDANKAISNRRAISVKQAVEAAAGDVADRENLTISAAGLGEAIPLGCDNVAWGRALNRRVEVWVSD